MTEAIARTRQYAIDSVEIARFAIVAICGCALVAAGEMLPL